MVSRILVNGTHFNVDEDLPHPFWSGVQSGRWEPDTFHLFDRILLPNWRFVDFGAWIGPTTLYAARKARAVDAYECDPEALRAFKRNLGVNPDLAGRVALFEHAVSDAYGFLRLYSQALGNSETSIFARHERNAETIALANSFLAGARDVRAIFRDKGYAACAETLVKIDVEGAEFRIVPRLGEIIGDSRCTWCVSFHEWNLNPPDLPAEPIRAAEMIRTLSMFSGLRWFTTGLVELDKTATLEAILTRSWANHASLVFANRDLAA